MRLARPVSARALADSGSTMQGLSGTSSALAEVLSRSCGDCHSNVMMSRWYSRVPPFSTLMARGAREGRRAINFSEWARYSSDQQRAFLIASCTDVSLGKMPVKTYLRFRPDAKLSTQDVETICSAARLAEQTPVMNATSQERSER
jgi:hypothetical protein